MALKRKIAPFGRHRPREPAAAPRLLQVMSPLLGITGYPQLSYCTRETERTVYISQYIISEEIEECIDSGTGPVRHVVEIGDGSDRMRSNKLLAF